MSLSQIGMATEDVQESGRSFLTRMRTHAWLAPCPGLHSNAASLGEHLQLCNGKTKHLVVH